MNRDQGYYWIRQGDEWFIAEYKSYDKDWPIKWYIIGSDYEMDESEIDEVGHKIERS
jgi:hypothetical protein